MNKVEREAQLRKAALIVAMKKGYRATTRHMVADQAKVSPALVPFYLGDVGTMRKQILRDGCDHGHLGLILEGIVDGERVAFTAAKSYRDLIMKMIFGCNNNS